jgi:septal ring factor EnvC (AmiA/AmiB activator)
MTLHSASLLLVLGLTAGTTLASGPGADQLREQHRQLTEELQQLEQTRALEQRKLAQLEALLERSRQLNAQLDKEIQAQMVEALAESPNNPSPGR